MQITGISSFSTLNNQSKLKQSKVQNNPIQQNVAFTSDKKVDSKKEAAARLLALALATGAIANPYSAKAADLNNTTINQDVVLDNNSAADISMEEDLAWHEQGGSADPNDYFEEEYEEFNPHPWEDLEDEEESEYEEETEDPQVSAEKNAMSNLKKELDRLGLHLTKDGRIKEDVLISGVNFPKSVEGIINKHNDSVNAKYDRMNKKNKIKYDKNEQMINVYEYEKDAISDYPKNKMSTSQAVSVLHNTTNQSNYLIDKKYDLNSRIKTLNSEILDLKIDKSVLNSYLSNNNISDKEKEELKEDKAACQNKIQNKTAKKNTLQNNYKNVIKNLDNAAKRQAIARLNLDLSDYKNLNKNTDKKLSALSGRIDNKIYNLMYKNSDLYDTYYACPDEVEFNTDVFYQN